MDSYYDRMIGEITARLDRFNSRRAHGQMFLSSDVSPHVAAVPCIQACTAIGPISGKPRQ